MLAMTQTLERPVVPAPPMQPDESWLEVVRILLLVQGAIAAVTTVEALVASAISGFATLFLVALNGIGAAATLLVSGRVARRRRKARRLAVAFQAGWLILAVVDLALTLFLTGQPFELVPILTRIALPLTIYRMLRSRRAREAFGLKPSRRNRRSARRLARTSEAAA